MTKHTTFCSSHTLSWVPFLPPQLSHCQSVSLSVFGPCVESPSPTLHILPPPACNLYPFPTLPVRKQNWNLSVFPEKEISLLFHLKTVKCGIMHCNWGNSSKKSNEIKGSLFFQLGLWYSSCCFVQTAEIDALANIYGRIVRSSIKYYRIIYLFFYQNKQFACSR